MQTVTLTPLLRESIGFDRFNDLFESAFNNADSDKNTSYPPYNIEKHGDSNYRIAMAVAGFGLEDLSIVTQDGLLTVSGQVKGKDDADIHYLHKGIANRAFEHKFNLSEYMEVKGASLANGLLCIDLKREVPESSKPKMIEIKTDQDSITGMVNESLSKIVKDSGKKKKPKLVS